MLQYFTNGFKPRPYNIYVLGPCQDTCQTFFASLREHISSKTCDTGDTIDSSQQEDDVPIISNSFTCIRKSRSLVDCNIKFTVTWDYSILEYTGTNPMLPQIDAFILLFRIDNQTDFTAVRTRHVPRLVALSEQHFDGTEKVLFIVAHRSNVFSTQQGFNPTDMKSLVATSHSTYRYANISQGQSCSDIIDLVVSQLNDVHSKHYFAVTKSSSARSIDSDSTSIVSKLLSMIPQCGTSQYTKEQNVPNSLRENQFRSYGTNHF